METERYFYIHRNKTKVPLLAADDGNKSLYLNQNTLIDISFERTLVYYIYDAKDMSKAAECVIFLTNSQSIAQTNKILLDFKKSHPVTAINDNETNTVPFCSSREYGMNLHVSHLPYLITRNEEIELLDIVFEKKFKRAESALAEWFKEHRAKKGITFDLKPHINQDEELAKSFLRQHGMYVERAQEKEPLASGYDIPERYFYIHRHGYIIPLYATDDEYITFKSFNIAIDPAMERLLAFYLRTYAHRGPAYSLFQSSFPKIYFSPNDLDNIIDEFLETHPATRRGKMKISETPLYATDKGMTIILPGCNCTITREHEREILDIMENDKDHNVKYKICIWFKHYLARYGYDYSRYMKEHNQHEQFTIAFLNQHGFEVGFQGKPKDHPLQKWINGLAVFGAICLVIWGVFFNECDPMPLFGNILMGGVLIGTLPAILVITTNFLLAGYHALVGDYERYK